MHNCKLINELKQSPMQWYKRFDSFMIKARYNWCEYDSCVYFKQSDDPTYLLLYADNMLIAAKNKTHVQKLKAQLKKKFDMKDLGEAKRFNMIEARPVTTPLEGHFKLSSKQCSQSVKEEEETSRAPYANA